MIKAEHKKWAIFLFNFYIGKLLRKNFNRFLAVNEFPQLPAEKSFIVTPNHFSWWDGFFADFTFKKITNKKIHLLMLEEQLKRYWFFAKVGAYSINLNKPEGISTTVKYSRTILKDSQNFLVIYPQGELCPFDEPIVLKEGLRLIVNSRDVDPLIIPAAFKILYGDQKKPDVLVRFGETLTKKTLTEDWMSYRDRFTRNVSELNSVRAGEEMTDLFKL